MKLSAIVLAAGASTRFGADKRLLQLEDGECLLSRCARQVRTVVDDVIVVLRPDDTDIANTVIALGCRVAVNPEPARGMGFSIASGVKSAQQAAGWLIIPSDLPLVRKQTITEVAMRLRTTNAVVPVCDGIRGHPVGFSRRYRDRLMDLRGETGGRQLLSDLDEGVVWLEVDDPGIYLDIDTRDHERMRLMTPR